MRHVRAAKHKIVEDIFNLTQKDSTKNINYTYKKCLRFLLNWFGNMSYLDGNDNKIKLKCYHANPERAIGIIFKDANIILPVLSISENSTKVEEKKLRYQPILINESYWHPKYQRAIRIVSLPPKPINLSYSLNIWSFYKNDLDQIREMIFSMFSPDLNITVDKNFSSKVFIESESDASELKVQDQDDRLLQKTINLTLHTSIPSPKYLYTSTGRIEKFNYEIDVVSGKIDDEGLKQLDALFTSEVIETDVGIPGLIKPGQIVPEHSHETYVTPEELQSMTWLTN